MLPAIGAVCRYRGTNSGCYCGGSWAHETAKIIHGGKLLANPRGWSIWLSHQNRQSSGLLGHRYHQPKAREPMGALFHGKVSYPSCVDVKAFRSAFGAPELKVSGHHGGSAGKRDPELINALSRISDHSKSGAQGAPTHNGKGSRQSMSFSEDSNEL